MKIFVDMDNTLNKLYMSYDKYYKELFGKKLGLTREGLTSYFIHEITGPNKYIEGKRKNQIFDTPGFWESIPIYDGAAEVMEHLNKEHEIFIVTAPWVRAKGCYVEKRNWLEKHLPFIDPSRIIYTSHKYLLKGDIIIDDCPEYIINNSCRWTIKMWYPFNEGIPAMDAATWKDIEIYVDNLKSMEKKYGRVH